MSVPDRRALLDRDHADLSIRRQCDLLGIARSGAYRTLRELIAKQGVDLDLKLAVQVTDGHGQA